MNDHEPIPAETETNTCPAVLVTVAKLLWACGVRLLRNPDGILSEQDTEDHVPRMTFPLTVLYSYDADREHLARITGIWTDELTPEAKPAFSAHIRAVVRKTGANCVLHLVDCWQSNTSSQPSQAPDRQACLILWIELQSGQRWVASQPYTRLGESVFIPTAMPEPQYAPVPLASGAWFQNWWNPTPVPGNN